MSQAKPETAPAPPLPMARAAGHPWAWHQVFAPGGYEWWHFDAQGDDGATLLAVDFFDGDPFDAVYRRRYRRFVRHPTRTAPPLPGECRAVALAVYRDGKRVGGFRSRVPGADFEASAQRPVVRMGASTMEEEASSGFRLELEGSGVRANLAFAATAEGPDGDPKVHAFPSRSMTGADHWWSPAGSVSRVHGRIELFGEPMTFAGRGWMDHLYGLGPLGAGLGRWMRGRVLGEEGAVAFMAAGRGAQLGRLTVRAGEGTLSRGSSWLEAASDQRIELGDRSLVGRRLLESAGMHERALYGVAVGAETVRSETTRSQGQRDEALCDILAARPAWLLGRFT